MWQRRSCPISTSGTASRSGCSSCTCRPRSCRCHGGSLAYQAMALVSASRPRALVARLAERAGWASGATLAGIAYILWLNLLGGSSGQSPVFYNLPVAAAAWLARPGRAAARAGIVAMALIGVSLQIKSTASCSKAWSLGLWLLSRRAAHRAKYPGARARGSGLLVGRARCRPPRPTAVYAELGRAARSGGCANCHRRSWTRCPIPAPTQLSNGLRRCCSILSPLIAMAGEAADRRSAATPGCAASCWCWLAVVLGGIVVFGGWFDHYGLPVRRPRRGGGGGVPGRHAAGAAPPPILARSPRLTGQIVIGRQPLAARHGCANSWRCPTRSAMVRAACTSIRAPPLLYPATGRRAATRYVFPSHLYLAPRSGSIGVDQADEVAPHPRATAAPSIAMRPTLSPARRPDIPRDRRCRRSPATIC